jgi:small subunit ribosomal protein S8
MSGITDPIGDMLTRIRNATKVGKRIVEMPSSNLRREVAKILVRRNFVQKFVIIDDGKQGTMKILLKYTDGQPAIQGIQRVSVPGRRDYARVTGIPKVMNGLGMAIVSTSKGLLTDYEAREQNIGGEIICKVW